MALTLIQLPLTLMSSALARREFWVALAHILSSPTHIKLSPTHIPSKPIFENWMIQLRDKQTPGEICNVVSRQNHFLHILMIIFLLQNFNWKYALSPTKNWHETIKILQENGTYVWKKKNGCEERNLNKKSPSLRQSLYGVNALPIAVNAHLIGACQTRILGGVGASQTHIKLSPTHIPSKHIFEMWVIQKHDK